MAALDQHRSRELSPREQLPGMPVRLLRARCLSEQREAGAQPALRIRAVMSSLTCSCPLLP